MRFFEALTVLTVLVLVSGLALGFCANVDVRLGAAVAADLGFNLFVTVTTGLDLDEAAAFWTCDDLSLAVARLGLLTGLDSVEDLTVPAGAALFLVLLAGLLLDFFAVITGKGASTDSVAIFSGVTPASGLAS